MIQGLGLKVEGFEFRVQGFGCWVQGVGLSLYCSFTVFKCLDFYRV
jgi:hypothetical protein